MAKNELAKKYQVQTAETVWSALKKCPDLVLVRAHHDEYQKYRDDLPYYRNIEREGVEIVG